MFESLLYGIVLGFGAAMPLGPTNLLVINTALQSWRGAFGIGFGALFADITYLVIIVLGLHLFLEAPLPKALLALLGALFLTFLSLRLYRTRHQAARQATNAESISLPKSWIKGYMLTLYNPYTFAFWMAISPLLSSHKYRGGWLIAGVLLAVLLWVVALPWAIHKTKHLLSQRILYTFSLLSTLIMLWFALILYREAWQILRSLY